MQTANKRQLKLGLFINPTGHHQAAWRHPGSQADAGINLPHYIEMTRLAEAAKFDTIFLADTPVVRAGEPDVIARVAQYVAQFEPITLLSALAAVTTHIGLIATASTEFTLPYQLARQFGSLDHISGGRAGWNIVTSGLRPPYANFGLEMPEYATRYERGAEFVEVCRGLWDSWDDDAFVRDKASGVFSDMGKMHVLNHHGETLKVRGPLNLPRPPQGHPVHVQAGSSNEGRDFAARYAEVVFVTPQSLDGAKETYRDVKARAVKFGRDPDHVKIMPGLAPIVGRTAAEAEEKWQELQSLLTLPVALNILSTRMGGLDLSKFDPDQPFPETIDDETSLSRTGLGLMVERSRRENLSVRELALETAGSLAGLGIRGSASQIADMMETWLAEEGCDGFNVQPAMFPSSLRDFVGLVIPELQRRGLFRNEYEGRTLRENLGLPRPASRYAQMS